jgi:hypothetical protein
VNRVVCIVLAALVLLAVRPAAAEFINVDIDCEGGGQPQLGEGAPAPSFAAAGFAGTWNLMNGQNPGPLALLDLAGNATGVTLTSTTADIFSCLAYNNPSNTGDYALLLNDASQAGDIQNGGTRTWTFNNLANGFYQVITYGAAPQGFTSTSPITVPGATTSNPQVVTGPMAGNALALGITHVIHDISVTSNTLTIIESIGPNGNDGGTYIQGFQLVPEPISAGLLAGGALLLRRRPRSV